MKFNTTVKPFSGLLMALLVASGASALTLTNPVVFVAQPPIPYEINGSITNTLLNVTTIFGNHLPDPRHCARGGDLWLMLPNTNLVNLTRKGGFGTNGVQDGVGIAVRDPKISWDGKKVLFSMVAGTPTNSTDTTPFYWQLYECTNLDLVISDTNTKPGIVRVLNQPPTNNNFNACYGLNGRIIFASDKPYKDQTHLHPARDEYKSAPAMSGIYSIDPATNDLRMLLHTPSGAFGPMVDSYARALITRWDHLTQDPFAQRDRRGEETNTAFNFTSELTNAAPNFNLLELFPEPRNFDTNQQATLGVNGNSFNNFFPWQFDPVNGGNEEIINHWGRHEFQLGMVKTFFADPGLITFSNLSSRIASGVISANTNPFPSFFHIVEDPRTNGLYWGTASQDISIQGGHHSGGALLTIMGPPSLNPTGMFATYITAPSSANGPGANGLYRDPMPMADGLFVASFSATPTAINSGWDTNTGTATLPVSQHHFRLHTLTNGAQYYAAAAQLTAGLTNNSVYWDGATRVTNRGTMWELQPVEVRLRTEPTAPPPTVPVAALAAFAGAGIDPTTFLNNLAAREMAIVYSHNVTARDAADKQQPYNLFIPGGTNSIANGNKAYAISHLSFFQADYVRAYTNLHNGRRILATPMHDTAALNYTSSQSNAPPGGIELMSDGSQATIVPANRAVTWHLTGTNNNDSVVKERYWIDFRPGEIRASFQHSGIRSLEFT